MSRQELPEEPEAEEAGAESMKCHICGKALFSMCVIPNPLTRTVPRMGLCRILGKTRKEVVWLAECANGHGSIYVNWRLVYVSVRKHDVFNSVFNVPKRVLESDDQEGDE